jgi:hypothetical protein
MVNIKLASNPTTHMSNLDTLVLYNYHFLATPKCWIGAWVQLPVGQAVYFEDN